jgi:adenylosuccinate synthase
LVLLRYSADINGLTSLVITKLDILSGFDELNIAVAYDVDGVRMDYPPSTIPELERAKPIYETLPGWHEDISHVRRYDDLPTNAKRYLQRISEWCDLPISMISVGPERDQLIVMDEK